MTSLLTSVKQIPANAGYFINVAAVTTSATAASFYVNTGTDAAPIFSTNVYAQSSNTSTLLRTAGSAVFKDHGKTLVSSGRVFRKVQLLVSTGSTLNPTPGSDGVAGVDTAPFNYITGYIELPGLHGASSGFAGVTPVARLG